jgi:hypothetical protein
MENGGLAVPWGCCTLGLPAGLAVRMEFRILGPLEVLDEGRRLALGGRKPRALLALLLLHRGETLGTERLIDELWGSAHLPPPRRHCGFMSRGCARRCRPGPASAGANWW